MSRKPVPGILIAALGAALSLALAVMRVVMRLRLRAVGVWGAAIAVGFLAAGVISLGGATAAASGTACRAPGAEPPNVGSGNNFLTGVAVTSACNAWAVGYYHKGVDYLALIEHWNGTAWKVQPSPSPRPNARLMGVAATSATNAWAVGQGPVGALIEHWNGKAWKIQPSPGGALVAVAASSAKNAWAVPAVGTLIEHWNGKAWRSQRGACPVSADECDLFGVAATSATNAWAVGSDDDRSRGGVQLMLIEHWNGHTWKVQPSPSPSGDSGGTLGGVVATSATNAWAVGSYARVGVSAGRLTFIERWNGKAWEMQPSPNPGGANGGGLGGVAATSATNAWAVGSYSSTGADRTLIERWNGTAWKVQPSPNPGSKSNALDAVAATSATNAWAVGDYHNATTQPPSRNLALHWNGSSWRG